jgi:hypothetical protein
MFCYGFLDIYLGNRGWASKRKIEDWIPALDWTGEILKNNGIPFIHDTGSFRWLV